MAQKPPPKPGPAAAVQPLAVNPLAAALLGPLIELFTPATLFILELRLVFPGKLQDILNRYLDLPVSPPQGSPESVVLRIKQLFEQARKHWDEGKPKEARAAMEQLVRYLFDDAVFAPPPPAKAPLSTDDLESLRREAVFMRDYVRAVAPR